MLAIQVWMNFPARLSTSTIPAFSWYDFADSARVSSYKPSSRYITTERAVGYTCQHRCARMYRCRRVPFNRDTAFKTMFRKQCRQYHAHHRAACHYHWCMQYRYTCRVVHDDGGVVLFGLQIEDSIRGDDDGAKVSDVDNWKVD